MNTIKAPKKNFRYVLHQPIIFRRWRRDAFFSADPANESLLLPKTIGKEICSTSARQ